MVKNFIVATTVGIGIAGLIFAIQNSASPLASKNEPMQQNNNLVSDKPFVEKPFLSKDSQTNSSEENLTNLFFRGIGKTVLQNNPDGPTNIDGKKGLVVPNPESVAAELLAEAAQKFNPASLRPTIKDGDLKILEDVSKAALTSYISNFQNIIKTGAQKIPKAIFNDPENLTLGDINQLSTIYQEVADKFYKLPVPRTALEIQKKEIELSLAKRNVFEKIKNYQNDPITAILATQELKKMDQEFAELDKNFSELIKKIGS